MTSSKNTEIDKVKIVITEVIDSEFCVASDDGQMLHNKIADVFEENRNVELSFRGIERLTTAFLNAAIGQLYNEFSEEKIKLQLSVIDVDTKHLNLLKKVVDRAKVYFKNKELIENTVRIISGDDDV